MLRFFPILLGLVIGFAGLAGSLGAGKPNDDGTVAAVFPPWWSPSHSLTAASGVGTVVDSGTLPFILIVQSDRPGLDVRLRAAGALFLFDPLGLTGCGQTSARNQNA